jgi:hypothetical protein
MNRKKNREDIPDDADEDDKYFVDPNTPTILRTEKIRFEEEGVCDRIKLRMDYKKGGRFFVLEDEKKPALPDIQGKLNPKEQEEEVFGKPNDELTGLPF